MIRVTVLYPQKPDAKFDHAYYSGKHLTLVRDRLTPMGLVNLSAEKGVGTMAPGAPAPFFAAGAMTFKSLEAFQQAFGKHGQELLGDIPKFTNVEPTVQISEVLP